MKHNYPRAYENHFSYLSQHIFNHFIPFHVHHIINNTKINKQTNKEGQIMLTY